MDDYSTYNPSSRTTFYEIDSKKGLLDDNPLKSSDFVDGKFYTSKSNASSYSAGNEVLVVFIKNGEYYSFKRTKDNLFSDNALDTTIVGAFGFKSIYALGGEIGRVISNNRIMWKKPLSERILLFSGQLTTSFTRLNVVYDTYIFSADGIEVVKQADDIGAGYITVGNHYIFANFNSAALYVKLYGGAFDIDIYGQN